MPRGSGEVRVPMQERSDDIMLGIAKAAAVFSSLAAAAYAATQSEASPMVELFLSFGPLLAVILWLQKDARRTGVGTVQDFGYFLLLAWPVVIPWYAFRTRGRSGGGSRPVCSASLARRMSPGWLSRTRGGTSTLGGSGNWTRQRQTRSRLNSTRGGGAGFLHLGRPRQACSLN
jgi:hypothetical protein